MKENAGAHNEVTGHDAHQGTMTSGKEAPKDMGAMTLHEVTIGYGNRTGRQKTVASDITATLLPGELTCLIGRNGSGKSTLLRTMAALQPLLKGSINIGERDITTLSRIDIAKEIGVVLTLQSENLNLTAWDVVALGRSPYTNFWGRLTENDRKIVGEAMESIGIGHFAHTRMSDMSDGERQKVMIAKALAQQSHIILLDEPTAFLDFNSRIDILMLLSRLAHTTQKAILLSTHDLQLCLWLADRLWLLGDDGKMTVGTPDYLAKAGNIAHLVEHEGITFDASTLTIGIE